MKGNQTESHRRERPMCRSATLQLQPLWTKRNHPPIMSFRANAVSRGIFPSGWFYLVVVLCQTWWIPPLRLRYGRNDITGGRLYGFAYCFQNVSRRPAPSSVSAAPSQLPRRGSFCTVLSGTGVYWERFRPFTHGTAHRPFPTVSLKGGRFQPGYSKDVILWLRLYGFAYCFQNVSRSPAPSSVRAAPCQLPRRGSFCSGL